MGGHRAADRPALLLSELPCLQERHRQPRTPGQTGHTCNKERKPGGDKDDRATATCHQERGAREQHVLPAPGSEAELPTRGIGGGVLLSAPGVGSSLCLFQLPGATGDPRPTASPSKLARGVTPPRPDSTPCPPHNNDMRPSDHPDTSRFKVLTSLSAKSLPPRVVT